MKTYFTKLSDKLEKGISKISNSDQTEIQKCEACKLLALEHYIELREFASNYQFKSEREEIEYFRSQKPKLVATLMYYYKKSKITKRNLYNDCKITKKRLQYELQKVEKFYSYNLDFISYYNSGHTNYDDALFLRKNMNPSSVPTYILLHDDSNHTTNGDHLVMKLLLNTKLYEFIQNELSKQSENELLNENTKIHKSGFIWTAPKSALIEVIYGLILQGAVNKGEVEIKQLTQAFESFFDIELGDPYRLFVSIKQRKKTNAIFLESLASSLIQHMNDHDQRNQI